MNLFAAIARLMPEVQLCRATPEDQLSAAIRLWNARDDAGAIKWGRRAARHLPLAKVALAQWLMAGRVEPELEREAVDLLTTAAEAGLPEAQQVLSACYLHGDGVPKDPDEAIEWSKRAADAGLVSSQLSMIHFLTQGEYCEPDIEAALHYAQQVAAAGHPEILEALLRDIENNRILGEMQNEPSGRQ